MMRASPLTPASDAPAARRTPLRFTWMELSGSLGDLGTFLPLAVGLSVVAGMDLGLILVFAGVMHIASGWLFRQPVPVQPMKAIAAVAITEGLLPGEIAAAGILMGVLILALALSGVVDAAVRHVPTSVVRGIQAGIGAKLALKGVAWLTGIDIAALSIGPGLPWLGWDSLAVAAAAGLALAWPSGRRAPLLLIVFLAGLAPLLIAGPDTAASLRVQLPAWTFNWPGLSEWWAGLWRGALPQLPLTLLNSVVAVCALSADYFPGRGLEPRRVAASVGLMNLIAAPFGGMPMCHGSGGLAAQHRFGARTGGSVIMLGAMKLILGLLLGGTLAAWLQAYPRSILGVMLIFAGLALARPARDSLRGEALAVVLTATVGIVAFNTAVGALAGAAMLALCHIARRIGARM